MRPTCKHTLFLLMLLCISTLTTFAQRTTGAVDGTVADATGAVVPNVSITLTGTSVGYLRTVQSDDQGGFRFEQIPVGTYKITTAPLGGFAATVVEGVTVTIEGVTTVNLKLGLSSMSESVVVTTDALGATLETGDSKQQTNITAKLIEQLPKGLTFTSLLRVSPATRGEGLAGGFQVDGASGSENSFVIDGVSVENFRTGTLNGNNNLPNSIISEVQIKTGGFEAEHGGASGGVIVVATKGGADRFHGEIGSEFEPSGLQPGPRAALSRFVASNASAAAIAANPDYVYMLRQPRTQNLSFYPTVTLSGPLVKSRMWFLGSYTPFYSRSSSVSNFIAPISNANFATGTFVALPRLVNGQPIAPMKTKASSSSQYAFSRIDAQITNTLRGSATYLWNPNMSQGILLAPITTTNPLNVVYAGNSYTLDQYNRLRGGRTNSNNFTSQLVYTPSGKMVATFRYGRTFLNQKSGNYAVPDETRFQCSGVQAAYATIATGCPGGIGFQNITNNNTITRDVSIRNEFNGDVTFLPSNFFGKHELKTGYQYGTILNDVLEGYANTGIVTLHYGRNYAQAGTGVSLPCALGTPTCLGVGVLTRSGTKGVGQNNYQGIYVQDKWQPSRRLALNLGVRLEKENLPSFNSGFTVSGSQINPIELGWGKKIAPRLGFAYDPFGSGKTKIYANYGWFYDRLRFELPRGLFGGSILRVDYFPITAANPSYNYYTPARILGGFTDPIGGGNPSTAGGLSQLQRDFSIPSNLSSAQYAALGLVNTGVDPDLKPFRQSEITFGFERELSRSLILTARFTRKNVDQAVEDHAILGLNESENYPIGNPGKGFVLALDQAAGYVKSAIPQRTYKALEIVLNKRLGNGYFFNANYTLGKLSGNYSGLASSDENGRTSPSINRFFDYAINGFTAQGQPDNGELATDRRHVFKSYGGYSFNRWKAKSHTTDLSYFFLAQQGNPQTTFVGVVATSIPLFGRGDLGRTPALTQTDLALTHRFRIKERADLAFTINALNVFNQSTVTSLNTTRYRVANTIAARDIDPAYDPNTQTLTAVLNRILNGQIGSVLNQLENGGLPSTGGLPNPKSSLYGQPSGFQGSRSVRFGFRLTF
ncbi:MAG: TonB-dependent receptor [Blastocatellia bacterium]|nr:TonB-dependent receptor [Blastocatellia bacterium]